MRLWAAVVLILLFLSGPVLSSAGVHRTFPHSNYELTTWDAPTGLSSGYIRSLIQSEYGDILVLTARELLRFDGGEFSSFPNPWKNERGKVAFDLQRDSGGKIWLLTTVGAVPLDRRGVVLEEGERPKIRPIPSIEGLKTLSPPGTQISTILPEVDLPAEPSLGEIHAAVVDPGGDAWIGTDTGLYRFPGKSPQSGMEAYLEGASVTVILLDREGTLWIGTRNSGLACLRRTVFTARSFPGTPLDTHIRSVFTDSRGRTWVSRLGRELDCIEGGR